VRPRTADAAAVLVVCVVRSKIRRARVEYWTSATLTASGPMLRFCMTSPRKVVKICQSDWTMLELSSMRKATSSVVLQ
jgi:protein tyrosine phosphatase (PTP) superfamily phosphohydrolase (DUF442 family)